MTIGVIGALVIGVIVVVIGIVGYILGYDEGRYDKFHFHDDDFSNLK